MMRKKIMLSIVSLLFFFLNSQIGAQDSFVLNDKTITRVMDPVILTGDQLQGLLGKSIGNIRVFAYREGSFQPIPFQVDEKNKKGKYCYTGGESPIRDENPAFDENDECIFIVMDSGSQVDPRKYIQDVDIWEVEIVDPVAPGRGWAYIAYYKNNPSRKSEKSYCKYTHVLGKGGYDIMESPWLRWYYPGGRSMPSEISVPVGAGGSGKNFIDTFKLRTHVSFCFNALKLKFNEDNIKTKTDAYIAGPVRIVRKTAVYMTIGYGLRTPSLVMDYLYYPHWCDVVADLSIPVSPKHICSEIYLDTGMDYNPNAFGCKMYNSSNPNGVLVDGDMSPEETNWDTTRDEWRVITGPAGSFFTRSLYAPELLAGGLIITSIYRDDVNYTKDPPDADPGEIGHLYQHLLLTNMKAGNFDAHYDFYFPAFFKYPDDIDSIVNIRDHKVTAKIKKLH